MKHFEKIKLFGDNSRCFSKNNYDWERCIIPKYLKVYEGVLNGS